MRKKIINFPILFFAIFFFSFFIGCLTFFGISSSLNSKEEVQTRLASWKKTNSAQKNKIITALHEAGHIILAHQFSELIKIENATLAHQGETAVNATRISLKKTLVTPDKEELALAFLKISLAGYQAVLVALPPSFFADVDSLLLEAVQKKALFTLPPSLPTSQDEKIAHQKLTALFTLPGFRHFSQLERKVFLEQKIEEVQTILKEQKKFLLSLAKTLFLQGKLSSKEIEQHFHANPYHLLTLSTTTTTTTTTTDHIDFLWSFEQSPALPKSDVLTLFEILAISLGVMFGLFFFLLFFLNLTINYHHKQLLIKKNLLKYLRNDKGRKKGYHH